MMTFTEMKEKSIGNYFDKKNLEFFGAVIEKLANDNGIFVESIDSVDRNKRLYIVKVLSGDGFIETVDPKAIHKTREHFSTLKEALDFAKGLTKAVNECIGRDLPEGFIEDMSKPGQGIYVLTANSGEKFKVDTNVVYERILQNKNKQNRDR